MIDRLPLKIWLLLILLCCFAATDTFAQEYRIGSSETRLVFKADKKIFPCKWRRKRVQASASPIKQEEIQRSRDAMERALSRYPRSLITENLDVIYMVRSMKFFGLDYGGTYFRKRIYLANDGVKNGYTDAYLEGKFHHEFSSILLKANANKFDKKAWKQNLPEDFRYGKGGREALKTEHTSLQLEPALYSSGFLNVYSKASLEEDFNCYAENLFLSDEAFWLAWEESEIIRNKTSIIIDFYRQLSPVFTLEYFRKRNK